MSDRPLYPDGSVVMDEHVTAEHVADLTARIAELEAEVARLREIEEVAEDWCHAVGEDTSWDSWDHHYKRLKWSLIPAYRAALAAPDTGGTGGE